MNKQDYRLWALLNTLGIITVLLVNYLANALPIAGRTPAQVSELYPTLFTPSGFTFAIWGVIYLFLIGFTVFQWLRKDLVQPVTGWWFLVSCLANAGWLLAFHHLYLGLSVLIMLVLLGSLIVIYLQKGLFSDDTSVGFYWWVQVPFSIYLGWISVATIANISVLFTDWGWTAASNGAQFWTAGVIITAAGLGLTALIQRRDWAYNMVIIWALYGIYTKRTLDTLSVDQWVEGAALTGIAVLLSGMLWLIWKRFTSEQR